MLDNMNEITDKEGWEKEVLDETILKDGKQKLCQ